MEAIHDYKIEGSTAHTANPTQGTNQTEMRVKNKHRRVEAFRMIQLVTCAEHGFGLWFEKLNSWEFGRLWVLYAFLIDQNLNKGVWERSNNVL